MEILIFVVLAGGYLARTIWKSVRSQTPSCGGCNVCPAAGRTGEQETPEFSKGGCDEDSISKVERSRS